MFPFLFIPRNSCEYYNIKDFKSRTVFKRCKHFKNSFSTNKPTSIVAVKQKFHISGLVSGKSQMFIQHRLTSSHKFLVQNITRVVPTEFLGGSETSKARPPSPFLSVFFQTPAEQPTEGWALRNVSSPKFWLLTQSSQNDKVTFVTVIAYSLVPNLYWFPFLSLWWKLWPKATLVWGEG